LEIIYHYDAFCQSVITCKFLFRIPPILTEKQSTSVSLDGSMGHTAPVEPTQLTSCAKLSSGVVAAGSSHVHSVQSVRKQRRKDVKLHTKQDLVSGHSGPSGQVSKTELSLVNDVTLLPSDIKLSPEVIVSINLNCIYILLHFAIHDF